MGDTVITKQYPDVSNVFERMEQRHERQQLESTLARTFIRMQRERIPAERQKLWAELLRLGMELERLNHE